MKNVAEELRKQAEQVKKAKEAQEMDNLFRELEKELLNAQRLCVHLKKRVEDLRRGKK